MCEDGIIRVADLPPTSAITLPATAGKIWSKRPDEPRPTGAAGRRPRQRRRFAAGLFPAHRHRLRDFLREQELTYVNRALAQTGGDKEKAAELLGVSVATFIANWPRKTWPRRDKPGKKGEMHYRLNDFLEWATPIGIGLFLLFIPPRIVLKGAAKDEFRSRLKIIRACGAVSILGGIVMLVSTFF